MTTTDHTTCSRRSLLKLLGTAAASAPFVTSKLLAAAPSKQLRHASFGAGGMAWSDLTQLANCKDVEIVAVCDVDLDRLAAARKQFPGARFYQDWRVLLDKEADHLDSVNIGTPDHMHAPIAMGAMQLGKHVYGQKPLAHDLHEVRRMTEAALKHQLVTQMGIQMHASAYYRMAVRLIQDGAIGKIAAVHSWSNKTWGDPTARPDKCDPAPATFNWALWQGVCAGRPFIGDGYYHPGSWRKRLDFGTGTLGDMGCHIIDPVFESIGLAAPIAVRSEGPAPNAWNWAVNGKVIYTFAGTPRTAAGTLAVTWYDGANKPPADIVALVEGKEFPEQGSLFIGTDGVMLLPHPARPALFPSAKFQDFKLPPAGGFNHWGQFVDAIRGQGSTSADFAYAGPLTEAILLGGIASRFPQTTLDWNSRELTFKQPEANPLVRRPYRQGWQARGLE